MEFRLLGPVEVRADGRLAALGSRKQRLVLAILLLEVNRLLPVERLVELTWDDSPPLTARAVIQTHIYRLRHALAAVDPNCRTVRLETAGTGYVLATDPMLIDAHRFRTLVAQARRVEEDSRRADLLADALTLWRGPALADVAQAGRHHQLCGGLEETRLFAIEERVEAELRMGRHHAVHAELVEIVHAHPTRERLVRQLMLALYRSGRAGEALDLCRETRWRLAEELGIDPGPELQELEMAILRNEPSLGGPTPPVDAGRTGTTPTPAQLPPDTVGFTGRRHELEWLDAILAAAGDQPTAVTIAALFGTAGVGKTALALHWAHSVAERFSDGQLYVNLRGFDPRGRAVEPAEAIAAFLDALGMAQPRHPVGLEALTALYRSLVAGKRILVMLDNARDADQVRPLLPGAPGCLVLVTSRNELTGLVTTEGAHPLIVDLLNVEDCRRLLAQRVGPNRTAAEPDAVDEIIARRARLPLALTIVAAHAATHPESSLSELAAGLRDPDARLDAFASGDAATDLRRVFSPSYDALGASAARLFRVLGLHPGPDIATPAVASLAAVPEPTARSLLAELARAHLITEHKPRRFTLHDLLRAYAAELAHERDSECDRHNAIRRSLDHYLHTAHPASRLLNPHREAIITDAPAPGVVPEEITCGVQAVAWFADELAVLQAVVNLAATAGFGDHAWHLAATLPTLADRADLGTTWSTNVALHEQAECFAGPRRG